MILEGIHDRGMPNPSCMVPPSDVALGRLIACLLEEKLGIRVMLGRT